MIEVQENRSPLRREFSFCRGTKAIEDRDQARWLGNPNTHIRMPATSIDE